MNPSIHEMRQELAVGEQFVVRYNKPGPRYTSYPTAPVWTDSFGPKDFENAIAAADKKRSPLSLYMHLPFCESLCLFCACNVVIQKNKSVTPPYLSILKKEVDRIAHGVSRDRQDQSQEVRKKPDRSPAAAQRLGKRRRPAEKLLPRDGALVQRPIR